MFSLRLLAILFMFVAIITVSLAVAGLSDPMRPPGGYAVSASTPKVVEDKKIDWTLQSVLLGAERAVAVINGVTVLQGEAYQGAKLIAVKADEVVLQAQSGKKFVLKLTPNILKVSVVMETNQQ